MLSECVGSLVSFCAASVHLEPAARLFPLLAAYLRIYIDDDTLPDLLVGWCVVSPWFMLTLHDNLVLTG